MRPKLVTFDCAETLVSVTWTVDGFARDCARHVGLELPEDAFKLYRTMYEERLPEFLQANLTRDPAVTNAFWSRLTLDWLRRLNVSEDWAEPLRVAAVELGFGPNSTLFRLFDDVVPCLDALEREGIRTAVVSNWDTSLHAVLRNLGVYNRFEVVLASLEEGVEKPDPRLFHRCLEILGVPAEEALHVGDNPIDDRDGAVAAGMRPLLLDRYGRFPEFASISTLLDVPKRLDWTG